MPIVGIDLGTTFSSVAYLDEHGKPVTVPNAEGDLTTPSVVLFDKSGDVVVGREARRVALSEPARVAEDVKRYMGETFYPREIDGQKLAPAAISGLILKKLKQDTERRIGPIAGAVITVPAYFDEGRRQATVMAGELAGLRVLDILNEPTSAALAYAYGTFLPGPGGRQQLPLDAAPKTVLVYDLGGGTFDVTVLRIQGKDLTVLATAGDVRLGGRDWDERLFDHMAEQFMHAGAADPRQDPMSRQTLMSSAEETKKILSQRQQTRFVVNYAGKSFTGEITRAEFNTLTEDLLYRTESRLDRVMQQAKLEWRQIDEVLAVGGSTRMPQVPELLKRVTGKEPNCTLSPDEAVAQGAAIYAAMCVAKASSAKSVAGAAVPLPAKADAPRQRPAVPPPLPQNAQENPPPIIKSEGPLDDETGRRGILKNFTSRIIDLLRAIRTTNVNAHSLGIIAQIPDGRERVSVLIPSNSQLPISVTRRYGTIQENQTTVTVRIVEGESRRPDECIPVGSCQIKQLPGKLPKGSPIDVTFTYDNSGRLHAKAQEPTSGTWATTIIQRRFGLDHGKTHSNEERLVAQAVVT